METARIIAAASAAALCSCGGGQQALPEQEALPLPGTWIVEDIDRTGIVDMSRISMTFTIDNEVSGETGCNLFSGSFTQDGQTITMGPLRTTRRACTAEAMARQEQRFLAAFQGPLRVSMTADGALVLAGEGDALILARPETPD